LLKYGSSAVPEVKAAKADTTLMTQVYDRQDKLLSSRIAELDKLLKKPGTQKSGSGSGTYSSIKSDKNMDEIRKFTNKNLKKGTFELESSFIKRKVEAEKIANEYKNPKLVLAAIKNVTIDGDYDRDELDLEIERLRKTNEFKKKSGTYKDPNEKILAKRAVLQASRDKLLKQYTGNLVTPSGVAGLSDREWADKQIAKIVGSSKSNKSKKSKDKIIGGDDPVSDTKTMQEIIAEQNKLGKYSKSGLPEIAEINKRNADESERVKIMLEKRLKEGSLKTAPEKAIPGKTFAEVKGMSHADKNGDEKLRQYQAEIMQMSNDERDIYFDSLPKEYRSDAYELAMAMTQGGSLTDYKNSIKEGLSNFGSEVNDLANVYSSIGGATYDWLNADARSGRLEPINERLAKKRELDGYSDKLRKTDMQTQLAWYLTNKKNDGLPSRVKNFVFSEDDGFKIGSEGPQAKITPIIQQQIATGGEWGRKPTNEEKIAKIKEAVSINKVPVGNRPNEYGGMVDYPTQEEYTTPEMMQMNIEKANRDGKIAQIKEVAKMSVGSALSMLAEIYPNANENTLRAELDRIIKTR